jgi:hypothetical protein
MSTELQVRWRDADDPCGLWSALLPLDGENGGFFERGRYLLAKPSAGTAFYIDDERIPDHADNCDCWDWAPGFFAGEVTAELTAPDGATLATYLLDVAPDPSKLGRDVFRMMIHDLWDEDPNLVAGAEPAMTDIGEQGVADDPWLAFTRLRRHGFETLSALRTIRACPRRSLRVRREFTPLPAVRRTDRRTASALLRSPGAISAVMGIGAGDLGDRGARLDVPESEETLDSAANRTMLALQLALLRRTYTVTEELIKKVSNEPLADTRTPLRVRWPRRQEFLDDLAMHLKRSIRSLPWRDVTRPEISAAGLTAIAADPAYSRAWSRGWRALRLGMEEGDPSERLWITPSWEIYERWCFVKIGKLLRDALPDWRWCKKSRTLWTWERGIDRVELELQPTFRAGAAVTNRRWSVSKERIPDLLLMAQRPGCVRFLLLDAKYRSSRESVLDAMTSAHIYHDSLRIGEQRPDSSLLLLPAAHGAEHLQDPAFQRAHRVGAAILRPGATVCLPSLVTDFLKQREGD